MNTIVLVIGITGSYWDVANQLYDINKNELELENVKNPLKRFLLSRKIKRLSDKNLIGIPAEMKVRELIKQDMLENPEDTQFAILNRVHNKVQNGLIERSSSFKIIDMVKMTLDSLTVPQGQPIDLAETAKSFRKELGSTYLFMEEKEDFRQKETTMGKNEIKNIEFAKIPEEMQKLQEEYIDAYENSKDKEEYIRRITRIYAKIIYLQPFEDCNKRTATCLLNSMMISRGVKPVPFSSNFNTCVEEDVFFKAFQKAQEGEFDLLEQVAVETYEKSGELRKKTPAKDIHINQEQTLDKGERQDTSVEF